MSFSKITLLLSMKTKGFFPCQAETETAWFGHCGHLQCWQQHCVPEREESGPRVEWERPNGTMVWGTCKEFLKEDEDFYELIQLVEPCVFPKNRFGFLIWGRHSSRKLGVFSKSQSVKTQRSEEWLFSQFELQNMPCTLIGSLQCLIKWVFALPNFALAKCLKFRQNKDKLTVLKCNDATDSWIAAFDN